VAGKIGATDATVLAPYALVIVLVRRPRDQLQCKRARSRNSYSRTPIELTQKYNIISCPVQIFYISTNHLLSTKMPG
jgi:hypothetical protein